jgi:hypothetical protein
MIRHQVGPGVLHGANSGDAEAGDLAALLVGSLFRQDEGCG